jgi:general secretion pathway protein G
MRSRRQRRRDAETRRHGDAETKEHSSHRSAAASSNLLSPRLRVSPSPRRSSGGWTLIELVVTVTVLAILTLGIVPLIKTSVKRQREQQLRETLRGMREAIKEFHRDTVGIQCAGATTGGVGGEAGQPGRPGAPPPYVDPRSKVVISDCNALNTTENPDLYPPSLELMVEGINVLPRATIAGAVGIGSVDTSRGQATDNKLLSTRKKHYLRSIPVDPITGKAEWDLHSVYDAPDSSEWGGENVFDVRSKSKGTALDGSKYNEW